MKNKTILSIVSGICFLIYTAFAITSAVYFSKYLSKVNNSNMYLEPTTATIAIDKNLSPEQQQFLLSSQQKWIASTNTYQQQAEGMTDQALLGLYIGIAIGSSVIFVILVILLNNVNKSAYIKKINESFANVGSMSIKATQYGMLFTFVVFTLIIFLVERNVIPLGPNKIDNTTSEGQLIQNLSIPKFIFGITSAILMAVSLAL